MGPLVVLALALAVAALAAAALAALQLVRGARGLQAGVEATNSRLAPLVDELRAEAAVSATESEALQVSLAAFSEVRGGQRERAQRRGRARNGATGRGSRVRPVGRLVSRRRRP